MAKVNKFTPINFNEVFEKTTTPIKPKQGPSSSSPSTSSSSLFSYSAISSSASAANSTGLYKFHLTGGRMLVLARPAPKPVSSSPPPRPPQLPDQLQSEATSDPVSLRPQVRTGSVLDLSHPAPSPAQTPLQSKDGDEEALSAVQPPKTDRFVPPHLRPGFAGKEEKPGSEVQKAAGSRARDQDRRPKSGGYERIRRGVGSDRSRASPSGNRPMSSGW